MTGSYAYTPVIWPILLTILLLITLSAYSLRRRSVPGALPFAIGGLLTSLWVTGSLIEHTTVDFASKVFMLPSITAVTCFILEYTWPGRWLTRRNLALLAIVPLLLIGLILTDDLHQLIWNGFTDDGLVMPVHGPVAWIALAYVYILGIVELIAFSWLFLRSPQHRWPIILVMIGQIGGRIFYLPGFINYLRTDLPLDVFVIAFLYLIYAIALFGFRIFDPIFVARQAAVDQIRAGMLVLDPKGRITSLNTAAERIFGAPASHIKGQTVKELLPAYPEGPLVSNDDAEIEFSLGAGQAARHYTLSISPLNDFRGLEIGRLLLLSDVTEQRQVQAQIMEQQRALDMLHERERLARELHDNLGQVFAFVTTQGQTIHRLLGRGDILTAQAYVSRLVEVAREADLDIRESILGLRATLFEQGFFPALAQYLTRYEKNFGIHTELLRSESFGEDGFELLVGVQLLRILQEALTNVRKHASAHSVRISFALEDGFARVTIKDNGQGFDPDSGFDEESGHVGLRVMRERAEEVGGRLSMYSILGQGAEVVVYVPLMGDAVTRGHGETESG
jgi:signal transduction histidine kinase